MTEKLEPGCRRPIQQRRLPRTGWTKAKRSVFLATLAESCNVLKAVAAAGMTPSGAYQLRKRDAGFAALWAEALDIGYERLEAALLEHALIGVNAIDIGEAIEAAEAMGEGHGQKAAAGGALVEPGAVQLALALLTKHRQTVDRKPVTKRGARPTPAETDAALRKQLDALARRLRESGRAP
ncbi:hypothetical protein OK349_10960 [Sphingomonas sp. BT-65]|uniref:hypothetical protein n=1 Tax=Sphingomonas sp. BT-65 TaxID=2989821 RepID=UPI002235B483|nr:hypothetical protein [Sphingomonas sp. BT-65]MCW4462226.1 hypothetical protein [Sphingomonas sp. BT-65]